ncbi:hypothetical protein C7C46_16430 [Streptomyces tateyamensis]|uniref:Uncharacterized protein n=1 Tax=Streptomyces tateyamensis TaxID=565073 RepID=A0A2V4N616_9ACTN|nr:hypothetical protein [Streptomyces tateyamensis]PYC78419.1 hypothetical protein C7C46_16430 [Streptomyces tateyamensis]
MTGAEQAEPQLPEERRSGGPRHAAPRERGRTRARLLAAAAVPTALLMGSSLAPSLASAVSPAGAACVPDQPATTVTPVPKSQLNPVPAATPKPTAKPTATPTATPSGAPTKAVSTGAGRAVSATVTTPQVPAGASQQQAAAAVTSQVVQASAVQPGTTQPQDLIGDILGGVAGIFAPHQATPTPAAAPQVGAPVTPSTPAPGTPAPGTPQPAPSATPSPNAPAPRAATATPGAAATPSGAASSTPAATGTPSTAPSGSATPSANPSPSAVASALAGGDTRPLCAVDTSKLAAAKLSSGEVVPDQSWTLHTTKLSLYGAVFGGVYQVHSPTRTYRVLKFTVSSVDIDNLDMSTIENTAAGGKPAETFHVKGGPNTTSTMRSGPITMYVESLSGQLSSLYGIPIPPLGNITLTPDTLPEWLYNLIGAIPIPIDMSLTGVKAVQAGQFGGTLHIPGMRMYNDTLPYDGL